MGRNRQRKRCWSRRRNFQRRGHGRTEDCCNPMNTRDSRVVVQKLLDKLHERIPVWPENVGPSPKCVSELVPGFSPFPFGCGLFRMGREWPDKFPEASYLFVLHNWGNQAMRDAAA